MRLCSDNALATATATATAKKRKTLHDWQVAAWSCNSSSSGSTSNSRNLQATTCTTFKGSLAARTEANKNMRYSLSAGMHLCTSSDSSSSTNSNFNSSIDSSSFCCCCCCCIRFQTFSFAAEKKLLQIYCLCFLTRRSSTVLQQQQHLPLPFPVPLSPSLSHSIHPALLLTIIIIIISVVSTFVAAALNTKELAYCSGQLLFCHLPPSPSALLLLLLLLLLVLILVHWLHRIQVSRKGLSVVFHRHAQISLAFYCCPVSISLLRSGQWMSASLSARLSIYLCKGAAAIDYDSTVGWAVIVVELIFDLTQITMQIQFECDKTINKLINLMNIYFFEIWAGIDLFIFF